jgi:hypothetical protein
MSALGQKRTPALQKAMSALPLIATAKADSREKSFGDHGVTISARHPPEVFCCAASTRAGQQCDHYDASGGDS